MQPLTLHQANGQPAGPEAPVTDIEAIRPKDLAAAARIRLEPLQLSARDLGQLLRVSVATIWRLRAAGKLPKATDALGSQLVRWSYAEIVAWQKAGMPDLKRWEVLKRP